MSNDKFKIVNINYTERDQKDFYTKNFALYLLFAQNYIADEESCKDIVQESFIKYWKQQNNFPDELSVKAFLYKTIRNKCLNYIRHLDIRNKYFSSLPTEWESEDFFMENVIKEEASNIILSEIEKLSEAGRKIILHSLDGLSNEEIARELKISINTVKTHKARSYITLRKKLDYLRLLLLVIS